MSSEILRIVEDIKSGKTTARVEVEAAIKRAESDKTNAILEVIRERALKRADEIDAKIKAGEDAGQLAGVPFVAKDNFLTYDSKTTAASKILENFEAPVQATAIEKLEAEGAICVGKANLDSFAHGGSTENSAFGVTKNAVDEERVAGGSSGGSAVAVANGIVPFALGSDTGGSIRQPASFNGVVGYKPTYGMISRYGVVAMASSTDVVGPIAKSVEDVQILCEILAGQDGKDSTVFSDYFNNRRVKAVLIHGTDGSPESNWLPWLKGKLENLGVTVFVPTMPIGDEQNLDNWNNALSKQLPFELDGNTILVGHSNGAAYMLSILNQGRTEPLLASAFVSGFYKDLPGAGEHIRESVKTFVDLDFDWDKIRKNAGKIIQFHGDNDPYVELDHAKELSEKMGGDLSIMKGGAHLNNEIGMTEFPELLDKIVWILKRVQDDKIKAEKKSKIGLIKQFIEDGVDKSVRDRTFEFVKKLRNDGYEVDEVDLPMAKYALPIYYIVTPAEISSNLARFDGIRYGLSSDKAKDLTEVYAKSRQEGFVDETKRRVMIGAYVLSSGFFDAYYLQAQKARTLLINEFNKLFEEYDFLVGPVAPTPAYKIGENIDDPLKMYMSDIMTCPASLAGLPALSLPIGVDERDLPIGIQIIGQMKSDAELLNFAKDVE